MKSADTVKEEISALTKILEGDDECCHACIPAETLRLIHAKRDMLEWVLDE